MFCRTVKPGSSNIPVPVQTVNIGNQVGLNITSNKQSRDKTVIRQIGSEYPNCGAKKSCANDEFSVHLYTGTENKDPPKICVDGS